jgi:hypothetical protein
MTRTKTEIKEVHRQYYLKHREEILAKQIIRWKKKYKEDPAFRAKRQLRDKSRVKGHYMANLKQEKCSECDTMEDLHRHHPSYKSKEFIILCRTCHNKLHDTLKE